MSPETFDFLINLGIVLTYFLAMYFGYKLGYSAHTDEINRKIDKLHDLADDLKKKNNDFLRNVSEVYNYVNGTDGTLNEMDIFLMDKWID